MEISDRGRRSSAEASFGLWVSDSLDGPLNAGLKFELELNFSCAAVTAAAIASALELVPTLRSHMSRRYAMMDLRARWCCS